MKYEVKIEKVIVRKMTLQVEANSVMEAWDKTHKVTFTEAQGTNHEGQWAIASINEKEE